ncbi:MAG: cytochrome c3 family protein [Pseudomonadota bacterium]
MDNESTELNIVFIFILLLVLFFSYCAIPSNETQKISHKKYTKRVLKKQKTTMDDHDKIQSADEHKETALKHDKSEEGHVKEKMSMVKESKPTIALHSKQTPEKTNGSDIIAMNNPMYEKHKKGIVLFTHKKHIQEYAIACGDCHHDEKGTPLELSANDPVKSCIECHKGTQKSKDEQLSEEEKIAKYHFEAIHANCVECHKSYNIEKGDPNGKSPAPVSCNKCHPKNK